MASNEVRRKMNVLAVDDKPANLLALEAALGDSYNVVRASSGPDAIKLLTDQPSSIDLILMDVQMPDMDGYQAASRIKELPGCENTPIIFISAVDTEDPSIKKGYQAGGIDYVTKPFNPDILKMKLAVYTAYKLREELVRAREESVREAEELLRIGQRLSGQLEGHLVGALISDAEGRIWQSNDELPLILGSGTPASFGETLGWWDVCGREATEHYEPLVNALHRGQNSRELQRVRCPDGSSKTILVSTSPLRRRDGAIVGVVVLIQDLSELRKIIAEEFEVHVGKLMTLAERLPEIGANN